MFALEKKDAVTQARLGRYQTAHGSFATPAFMPVGTQATVKAMRPEELKQIGAQILLGNTYHLLLRPGHRTIEKLGGLHRFMNWSGPILTDSGGYQVFSLAKMCRVSGEGVKFQSHLDGAEHLLTPEFAVEIQEALDSDIMMVLDECLPYPSTRDQIDKSLRLTVDWAQRCFAARKNSQHHLFAIVQGGMEHDLRLQCLQQLLDLNLAFEGFAIGGVSVGEPMELGYEVMERIAPRMPEDKPRYAMGIGMPEDIIRAIGFGVDMFDCVAPTRSARHGLLFTPRGRLYIRQAAFAEDGGPLQEDCPCYTCRHYSRAYLRHLSLAKEPLSAILNTLHNLHYYFHLLDGARRAVAAGRFLDFQKEFLHQLHAGT
jgi:queuine tRNA-ribosyltransferase